MKLKITKKVSLLAALIAALASIPLYFSLSNAKASAYSRAKKIMSPDLYLIYRLAERILDSNSIDRPLRVAVRRGAECEGTLDLKIESAKCAMIQHLPDVDKSTNFDLWASQVVNTMVGSPNALASSISGMITVNIPMLKEVMGKPNQLACVISHEIAHVTQNHSEAMQKKQFEFDVYAANKISLRLAKMHKNQNAERGFAIFMGGLSAGISGDNSSLNNISNSIAMQNIQSQLAAPQIASYAMKFSPNVGTAINKMQGLTPNRMKLASDHVSNHLRDASLALTAFSRGQEYEADLLGAEYLVAAGFNPQGCIKLWDETMPHDTDKVVARLLPDGTPDPGKPKTSIIINKGKDNENEDDINCERLSRFEKNNCKRKKRKKAKDTTKVPEDILAILSTHPSDERRLIALKNHLANQDMIKNLQEKGKLQRKQELMRDWSYDKETDSVIISNNLIEPSQVGLEKTGTTGINIDSFLGS